MKSRTARPFILVVCWASAVMAAACHKAPDTDPRLLTEWMRTAYGIVRAERLSPPVGSRLMAYASTALYSGIAATSTQLPPLTGTLNGFPTIARVNAGDFDQTITAVAAERVVLDSILREGLPTTHASVNRLADSLIQARVALGVQAAVRARSDSLGRQIGYTIVQWARGDGFDSTRGRPYVAAVGKGLWMNDSPISTYATQSLSRASDLVTPTNPSNTMTAGTTSDRGLILSRPKRAGLKTLPAVNMAGATEPYWSQLRPFALRTWDECPVPNPRAYSEQKGSPLFEEARVVYTTGLQLTPEQRTIALYWADNAGESGTPAGHWLAIVSQIVSEQHLSAERAVGVMTETSVSIADAFISTWGHKYRLNTIRPRPYIRLVMDPTWEPLIPTPPFPEYVSGHSAVSAAAATVMTSLLGNVAFEDSTGLSIGHNVRKFESFRAASDEAGLSRIYAGIHFPSGNVQGAELGRCVAGRVVERFQSTVKR